MGDMDQSNQFQSNNNQFQFQLCGDANLTVAQQATGSTGRTEHSNVDTMNIQNTLNIQNTQQPP